MSEKCSYENLQKLFDEDVLVGLLKERHLELKMKNNAKCAMLVASAQKAWVSYLKFQENRNDENLYEFLQEFRKFAYDRPIKVKNFDAPCYDLGFVSIIARNKRLGRQIYIRLMKKNVDTVAMAELYGNTMVKADSPFFEFERLY